MPCTLRLSFQLPQRTICRLLFHNIKAFQDMANIHGFHELRRNQGIMGFQSQEILSNSLLYQEYRQNRIPFFRSYQADRHPLDETIPYTFKLYYCPTIKFYHPAFVFVVVIWILYILCLTQGFDSQGAPLEIDIQVLINFGAMQRNLLKEGQVWRLIPAAFLHIDLLHIVMNTLSIMFYMTRLQSTYHPHHILLLILVSAISGNILSVFGQYYFGSAGSSTIIFGCLGVYIAYVFMNWEVLRQAKNLLCRTAVNFLFFGIMFLYWDEFNYLGYIGGTIGGFLLSLAAFPTILPKKKWMKGLGAGGLFGYFLTTFLVFFLS